MKKIILLLAVFLMALAIIPAVASAHVDYNHVNLTGNPWSNTSVTSAATGLRCGGQVAVVSPGNSVNVRNLDSSPGRLGFGVWLDASHIHPFSSVTKTGAETVSFFGNGTDVGTRRVWYSSGGGVAPAIRVVNFQSNGYAAVIRAEC